MFIVVFLASNGFAQQYSTAEKIKHANYVEIHFLKGKQPFVYKTKRKMDLTYLKNLIINAKNDPGLKSDTTGIIIYFKDKIQLAKVYFSTRATDSKYKFTGGIAFKDNDSNITSKLNYGTGMLVDEVFYNFQKRK